MYSEPSQTYEMEVFVKIVNGFEQLYIFAKTLISDVWLDFEYNLEMHFIEVGERN